MGKFYTQANLQINDKQAYKVFDGKKQARLGTEKNPAVLIVNTQERKTELEKEFLDNGWFCHTKLDNELPEDTSALQYLRGIPKTVTLDTIPGRNTPCPCGSGKKYKKCCA